MERIGWKGAGLASLALMVAVPFLALVPTTMFENRFFYRSVSGTVEVSGRMLRILGMSMLGDTMVWPFFILVPLALLLLKHAVDRTARGFSAIRASALTGSNSEGRPAVHERCEKARLSLAAADGWRWARRAAIVLGLGFCA